MLCLSLLVFKQELKIIRKNKKCDIYCHTRTFSRQVLKSYKSFQVWALLYLRQLNTVLIIFFGCRRGCRQPSQSYWESHPAAWAHRLVAVHLHTSIHLSIHLRSTA